MPHRWDRGFAEASAAKTTMMRTRPVTASMTKVGKAGTNLSHAQRTSVVRAAMIPSNSMRIAVNMGSP
ncbi:MAG: hypothetical protein WC766_02335 [Patescibacteria group bacterium]